MLREIPKLTHHQPELVTKQQLCLGMQSPFVYGADIVHCLFGRDHRSGSSRAGRTSRMTLTETIAEKAENALRVSEQPSTSQFPPEALPSIRFMMLTSHCKQGKQRGKRCRQQDYRFNTETAVHTS